MVAPETWAAPASGGTDGASTNYSHHLCQAGAYWFSFTYSATGVLQLRYATDPTGTWTAATLPSAPGGYGNAILWSYTGLMTTDGTSYAFLARYNGTPNKYRVIHATDPSGTWSSHELDATDTYVFLQSGGVVYADGYWAACGYEPGGTINPLLYAATTVDGTYTAYTSSSETGYAAGWNVVALTHDGTQWVSVGVQGSSSGNRSLRYSTSLLSGWTTPGASPFGTNNFTVNYLRAYSNGWYVVRASYFWYTDDLTGAFTEDTTAFGLPFCREITWQGGYWVASGTDDTGTYERPLIGYQQSTSPAGTYTQTDADFDAPATTNVDVYGIWGAGGYVVAGAPHDGQIRYAVLRSPTYLRQRQSPVRSPSRVRGTDLRQRQTPRVT